MRKAIRTTIEEEMLEAVKQVAKEKHCNINDVLEELISMYIFWHKYSKPDSQVVDNSENQLQDGISNRIKVAIKEIIVDYGLSFAGFELERFIDKISDACGSAIYLGNFVKK